MGGIGKRFREAGYTVPKYMIDAKGKSLFEWSLLSLRDMKDHVEKYVFVALKDKEVDVNEFITQKCEELNIRAYEIVLLDELTDGQATSANIAMKYCSKDIPVLIYNIDTYVEPGEMKFEDFKGDGFIPCFKADGDHWSFVKLDENGCVTEIKEKVRISDNCTIGAYYFRTAGLYSELYKELYVEPNDYVFDNKEKYIAPMYDYLLKKGGEIYISDIPGDKVHVLGTPKELDEFIAG